MDGLQRLKAWMEANHITGRELSKRLEVSEGHISDIINKKRRPSIDIAAKIETTTGSYVMAATWARKK